MIKLAHTILIVALYGGLAGAAQTSVKESAQREAKQLWEQAIAAKGGRERLYGVRNMVVSQRATFRKNLFKSGAATAEGDPIIESYVRDS